MKIVGERILHGDMRQMVLVAIASRQRVCARLRAVNARPAVSERYGVMPVGGGMAIEPDRSEVDVARGSDAVQRRGAPMRSVLRVRIAVYGLVHHEAVVLESIGRACRPARAARGQTPAACRNRRRAVSTSCVRAPPFFRQSAFDHALFEKTSLFLGRAAHFPKETRRTNARACSTSPLSTSAGRPLGDENKPTIGPRRSSASMVSYVFSVPG